MFTGIIEEIGRVAAIKNSAAFAVLTVQCRKILKDVQVGDSIAVNGVCLTVTSFTDQQFTADIMHETLNRSNLGSLRPGCPINLERAMAADGRFGGHLVSGHIDGTGTITGVRQDGNATWYTIQCNKQILRYIIEKGSVAIDGASLTVAKLGAQDFSVSLIPHTSANTVFSGKQAGDAVNIENDCTGKYIERLLGLQEKQPPNSNLTKEFLLKYGF